MPWELEVEAALTTRDVQRLARENGLYCPVDPGAAEQPHIGGNVATNAGGPHAFKYGVTRDWVTGIQAVTATGELIELGGNLRKDVAGYDLRSLLCGSEGTLAFITAVSLRLIPAVPARLFAVGFHEGAESIAEAVRITSGSFPGLVPGDGSSMTIAEADGSEAEAQTGRELLKEALGESAIVVWAPDEEDAEVLWRWREGVGLLVDGRHGGKMSEDVVVPVGQLAEVIDATCVIGRRHGLDACSWGHAGDGNVHSDLHVRSARPGRSESCPGGERSVVRHRDRFGRFGLGRVWRRVGQERSAGQAVVGGGGSPPPGGKGPLRPRRLAEPGEEAAVRFFRVATSEGPVGAVLDDRGRLRKAGPTVLERGDPDGAVLGSPAELTLLAPVLPGKIVAIGLNYRDHIEEADAVPPEQPLVFAKFPSSVTGPADPIRIDLSMVRRVDWEVELGVVIGQVMRNVPENLALGMVAGYTVANDISARDVQNADEQWVRGKSFDTFCPLGPCVTDEITDPQPLRLTTRANGEVMQSSHTGLMLFSVAELLSYCSRCFTLLPEGLLLTGTPWGCGEFMRPRRSLQPDDLVEAEISGIGVLRNPVVEG